MTGGLPAGFGGLEDFFKTFGRFEARDEDLVAGSRPIGATRRRHAECGVGLFGQGLSKLCAEGR